MRSRWSSLWKTSQRGAKSLNPSSVVRFPYPANGRKLTADSFPQGGQKYRLIPSQNPLNCDHTKCTHEHIVTAASPMAAVVSARAFAH